MTFEQLVAIVQRWQRRMTPAQLRDAIAWVGDDIEDWPPEIPLAITEVLKVAAAREPPPPMPRLPRKRRGRAHTATPVAQCEPAPPKTPAPVETHPEPPLATVSPDPEPADLSDMTAPPPPETHYAKWHNQHRPPFATMAEPAHSAPDSAPDRHVGADGAIGTRSARRLLRALLRHRPRDEVDVRLAAEAAAIPARSLLLAAEALGVEQPDGQWRLPG